jgi:hypothetical protein
MTLLAYRFALDPTPAQERALRSNAGAARAAFNWGLARVRANLGQREAEKSYGIAEDDLTPPLSWSLYSLRRDWGVAVRGAARGAAEDRPGQAPRGRPRARRSGRGRGGAGPVGDGAVRAGALVRVLHGRNRGQPTRTEPSGRRRRRRPRHQNARRQPGTAQAGQTGTVAPQGEAAARELHWATALSSTHTQRYRYFSDISDAQPDAVLPLALAGFFQARLGQDANADALEKLGRAAAADLALSHYLRGLALTALPPDRGRAEQAIGDLEFLIYAEQAGAELGPVG